MVDQAPRWAARQLELRSARRYTDPFWDVDVHIEINGPHGHPRRIDAFWDGGSTWRARFRPDEPGRWRWRSIASADEDAGLHGRQGEFRCVPYQGDDSVLKHGPVRPAPGGWHFIHADGTPFLWLGDTAWNGLIRSTAEDWDAYLSRRREQGFSVIQVFSTNWRALANDAAGRRAFSENGTLSVDPAFFAPLDAKVAAIERHGMLASVVVLLALYEDEPGWRWPEAWLVRFERWLRARWQAYHVAWTIGGDGDFSGPRAERWRRVGAALASDPTEPLVTLHPKGWTWIGDDFRDEPWYTFVTYQSCHSDEPEEVAWLPTGPPAHGWQGRPPRPIINIESNYEDHPAYASGIRFTDREVRRAAYWSIFVTPTAGVSYGDYSLWAWATEPERIGAAIRGQEDELVRPWQEVIDAPGARSMGILRAFLESGPWWTLRPAQDVLSEQPGSDDATAFMAAARGADGDWVAVYSPAGGTVRLRADARLPVRARWFDPRTGSWTEAVAIASGETLAGDQDDAGVVGFEAPDDRDWLLDLRSDTLRPGAP